MTCSQKTLRVLVVCKANYSRSPMGEAVLRHIASERGIDIVVDSCGASLDPDRVGTDPNMLIVYVCEEKHNVPISCQARQLSTSDYTNFTHILACDESNLQDINQLKPADATAEIRLWGSYLDGKPIPDPPCFAFGKMEDYEKVYQQCVALSNAFLDEVTGNGSV